MLTTLLLGLTLALPPTQDKTELLVDFDAGVAYRPTSVDSESAPGREIGGFAAVGFTLFDRAIVDDDAAPSLQPYLQYATQLHVGGGGGYVDRRLPDDDGSSPLTQGWLDAEASGYLARRFYIATAFEWDYDTWRLDGDALSEQLEQFNAAIGLRFGDVRVSTGWGGTAFAIGAGRSAIRYYGGAFAEMYAVVDRRFEVDALVRLAEGGAEGRLGATWWLGRRLGLGLGASGGAHAYVDSADQYAFASGSIAATWWFTPRLAGQVSYAATWQEPIGDSADGGVSGVRNALEITMFVR
ncbi:MAG TPA: hypothetical protein VHB97_17905 [Polyangia bacterium]|nr:hypothetical protein [Polyangia bacterium]